MARTRLVTGTLLAAMGLLGTSSSTLADTELGHQGDFGRHRLEDSGTRPGARCHYRTLSVDEHGYRLLLDRISVRPPRMRSIGETGRVGWRAVVQRGTGTPGTWATVARTRVQTARATAARPAEFERMALAIEARERTDELYRVLVRMRWYGSGGAVRGSARHRVDHHRTVKFYGKATQFGPCQGFEWAVAP